MVSFDTVAYDFFLEKFYVTDTQSALAHGHLIWPTDLIWHSTGLDWSPNIKSCSIENVFTISNDNERREYFTKRVILPSNNFNHKGHLLIWLAEFS